jgi:acetyl/propionyl-CoA carboxylase alpha subunit
MGDAAVAAARASGYVNAGTVEFLLDGSGRFYFLEVNTRLQVEHPITEMTTGIDLVRKQIEIAAGLPLELPQEAIKPRGHSMECRIYAEDPEDNFFPSPGPVLFHREPAGPGIRNDCGIYGGFRVPMEYDPILSKLIVFAETREAARTRMLRALEDYVILGIRTTIPFLIDVLKSGRFIEGDTRTDFIDRHFEGWQQGTDLADLAGIAYVARDMERPARPSRAPEGAKGWQEPWETLGNWRL